ncbi:hypothetical protein V7122_23785 [Bacillus sp. JJ1532]|uniref:hypothetical protein n=1 Tax=unclassified Bacillus (in: firmicutes) TaxID=185979 RepID=UPI0030000B71
MYEQIYVIEKLEQYKQEELRKKPYYYYEKKNRGINNQLCRLPVIHHLPSCQCTHDSV